MWRVERKKNEGMAGQVREIKDDLSDANDRAWHWEQDRDHWRRMEAEARAETQRLLVAKVTGGELTVATTADSAITVSGGDIHTLHLPPQRPEADPTG
jgi:hypothetical protein